MTAPTSGEYALVDVRNSASTPAHAAPAPTRSDAAPVALRAATRYARVVPAVGGVSVKDVTFGPTEATVSQAAAEPVRPGLR